MTIELNTRALGPLELQVLEVFWRAGGRTGRQVHAELGPKRGIAYTTVRATIDRLHEKGVLTRRKDSSAPWRAFVFQPAVTRPEVLALAVTQLLDDLGADANERQRVAVTIAG